MSLRGFTVTFVVGVILFTLFVFFRLSAPVFADDVPPGAPADIDLSSPDNPADTSPIGKCNGPSAPGAVCHNPPDALDKTVEIGQSTPTCWWTLDPITKIRWKQCLKGSTYPFHYDLHYKPAPGYVRPMYDWFAQGLALAAVPKLLNGLLQKELVPFTNPQVESDMGRACYWDDDTGTFKALVPPEDISKTKFYIELPWVNSLVQNADILSQENSNRKRNDQYYEQSTEYIKKAALFGCGSPYHGTKSYTEGIKAIGEVTFDPRTVNATITRRDIGISVAADVFITNSKRTGKIEQIAAFGPGVLAADLSNDPSAPITQAEKDYYATHSGFITSFAPGGIQYYHPGEVNGKVVDNPFEGSFNLNTTTTSLDKLVDNGYMYLCQTLFPGNMMPSRCVQPTPTPTLDVCGVAQKYSIPCCMLKGEMQLETGGGTTMGNESCSTNQGNFTCCNGDVCGPAQVSCSQYDAFAGKDKLDMCSAAGAAELLARAMHLKLCQAAGQCDSYDWATQGTKAMRFAIPSNINDINSYTALGYFYGMNQGCVPDACTQYRWGAGKSYCDAIQNYCKSGQILPDNTTAEFCTACSQETSGVGQSSLTCQ